MAKQPGNGRNLSEKTDEMLDHDAQIAESASGSAPLFDPIPPEVLARSTPERKAAETPVPPHEPEPAPQSPPQPQATPAAETAPPKATGSGFVPLILGGLLSGVIGFAVATFTAPATDDGTTVQLAQQAAAITALEERLADVSVPEIAPLEAELTAQISDLSERVDAISARLDALEQRPEAALSGDPDAGAAVTSEMDALRAELAEMAQTAQAELDEARAAAAQIENSAAAAARNAAARAALARVQSALETGAPIGAALADLEAATGEGAPQALLAVADGVPSLPALQDSFADAARAALATARSEGVAGEETSGIGAFLRNQFEVRSTAPREGNDADAVLSRAEAALKAGRLSDALAELGALPEVARAEMSDWLAAAEARAEAVAATDVLSSSLSDN